MDDAIQVLSYCLCDKSLRTSSDSVLVLQTGSVALGKSVFLSHRKQVIANHLRKILPRKLQKLTRQLPRVNTDSVGPGTKEIVGKIMDQNRVLCLFCFVVQYVYVYLDSLVAKTRNIYAIPITHLFTVIV